MAQHEAINLAEKLSQFDDHWSPRTVATFNGHDVMVVKVKGEFVWHSHSETDDFFLVLSGRITIQLRGGAVELGPGEMFVVPVGVEHKPVAAEGGGVAADRAVWNRPTPAILPRRPHASRFEAPPVGLYSTKSTHGGLRQFLKPVWVDREDVARRAGGGPNHIKGQQVGVDPGAQFVDVADGGYTRPMANPLAARTSSALARRQASTPTAARQAIAPTPYLPHW